VTGMEGNWVYVQRLRSPSGASVGEDLLGQLGVGDSDASPQVAGVLVETLCSALEVGPGLFW
jgi:hypothetical protein